MLNRVITFFLTTRSTRATCFARKVTLDTGHATIDAACAAVALALTACADVVVIRSLSSFKYRVAVLVFDYSCGQIIRFFTADGFAAAFRWGIFSWVHH